MGAIRGGNPLYALELARALDRLEIVPRPGVPLPVPSSLAGLLAMGALVLSRLVFVKELGLGVAFAVLLDATLVRAVLVPAVMGLLGSGNRGHA